MAPENPSFVIGHGQYLLKVLFQLPWSILMRTITSFAKVYLHSWPLGESFFCVLYNLYLLIFSRGGEVLQEYFSSLGHSYVWSMACQLTMKKLFINNHRRILMITIKGSTIWNQSICWAPTDESWIETSSI